MAREKRTPKPKRTSPFDKVHKALKKIGEAQKTLARLENNRKKRVELIESRASLDSAPHRKAIADAFDSIFEHANKQRKALTQSNKRKRIYTPHGVFGWRLNPPSVTFKVDEATAIANAKSAELEEKLVHVIEKFKKKALLDDPKLVFQLPSVEIAQCEVFYVQPTNLEEIRRNTEPIKKVLV